MKTKLDLTFLEITVLIVILVIVVAVLLFVRGAPEAFPR